MKYAFSTLGLPGLPPAEVVRLATGHGYQGVELRAHPEEPVHPGLTSAERSAAAREFRAGGIEVSAVAGYPRIAAPGPDGPVLDEILSLAELAHDLGSGFVRVFPGAGESAGPEADARAARRLSATAAHAAGLGVRILLETHDSHRTGADAARVLDGVPEPGPGALWDVMHTWLGGESPAGTLAALGDRLAYVQVKDISSAQDTLPLALGAGVLPLGECLRLLAEREFGGWVCWEYEKRWYEQAAPFAPLLGPGREHLDGLLPGRG